MSNPVLLDQALKSEKSKYPAGLTDDEAFELFCASNLLKDYELSYDEVSDGIVDGSNDGGIDAAFVFVNGQLVEEDTDFSVFKGPVDISVVIIQSKNQTSFKENVVDKLSSALPMLLDFNQAQTTLASAFKADLVSVFMRYRKAMGELSGNFPQASINIFYCTKGNKPSQAAVTKANALSTSINKQPGSKATFAFCGAEELYQLARKQARFVATFPTEGVPLFGTDSYVALCKLSDYAAFISDAATGRLITRLFEANVRAYQGDVEVNKEIDASLKNAKANIDFWWLNNGVTIVADKVQYQNGKMTMENPLIVNGLQTSHVLHDFFQNTKDTDRHILVRVIQEQESSKRDQIIKATNRQTAIKASSLRATEEVHRRIEDYFLSHGFFYDRRKNFYKNEGKPADRIISMDKLAQASMSVLLRRPDDARARPTTLIKNDADYGKLFPGGSKMHPLQLYLVLAEALAAVEAYFKSTLPKIDKRYANNLKFHVLMVTVWELVGTKRPPIKAIENIDVLKIKTHVAKAATWVMTQFDAAGGTDQVAKDKGFTSALDKTWVP